MQGPRAQADRKLYRAAMQAAIRATPNLEVIEGGGRGPDGRGRRGGRASSPPTAGAIRAGAVVLTTGTFLRGLIHRGEEKTPAGRHGEPPANGLSAAPAGAGSAARPPQDRHAGAPRRPHDRLGQPGDAARRRSARAVLIPDRAYRQRHRSTAGSPPPPRRPTPSSAPTSHRAPMYSGPDRQRRPALLPLHRGQGGAVRRPGRAPDLPGARGPGRRHRLPQRRLHLPARPTCRRPSCAPFRGWRRSPSGASATPSSTTTWTPASSLPTLEVKRLPRPVPGRPDQRHHRLRGGRRPGPGRRHQCRAEGGRRRRAISSSRAPTATWA